MNRPITLLEAAISCGSPPRGTEGAFDALVSAGLAHLLGADTVPMEKRVPCEVYPPHLRHLDTVMAVSRQLRENVLTALERGRFPLVMGGDHSVAMGTLAALGEFYGPEQVALVYIDAHTDINTEKTSASGCIHGMDLAAACGLCCDELNVNNRVDILPRNIHILGARSIDPPEHHILRDQGVDLWSAEYIRKHGMEEVLREILPALEGKKVHISFDVDAIDPLEFAATGYNLTGGLTVEQVRTAITTLRDRTELVCVECVEYNPLLDEDGADGKTLLSLLEELKIEK